MYYGSKKTSPAYYGTGPTYYGAAPSYYGQSPQYSEPGYGGVSGGGDGEGGLGALNPGRILRVVLQRWFSVFAFLLVGVIVSFVVYRMSPTIYRASSEFTMDMRHATYRGQGALAEATPDYGTSYAEIFNTRLSDWRSQKLIKKVIQQYRSDHPDSTFSESEVAGVLAGTELDLVRNSRIITISIRSESPELCAHLANAYAEAIESFTDEENKLRCDKAVTQIHGNVERKRKEVDEIARQLLEFRTAHQVDNLRSARDTVGQSFQKTTSDILTLESEETQLVEWEKMLAAVQRDPASYGSLSTGVPRAQEIATEFRAYQDAEGEYQKLIVVYTESHPEVVSAKRMLELARQRFIDAASRALQTGRATLQVTRNQLANLRQKQDNLRKEQASLAHQIVLAESGLGQQEAEFGVANRVLEGLIMDENKARIEAESNNEIVRVGRPASVPSSPIQPNPTMIFGVGIFVSIGLGVLFVLLLDHYEDTIISLADIEGRLALKVLVVLPHLRASRREEVAKSLITDKFSQFAETMAGLRNLLASPRYEALSHCVLFISTQPGEGKTITSTSLAISHAQSGKKVLHVDFDLRRPRLARIWNLELTKERSFSHVLQNAAEAKPDFAALANPTDVPGLDVIGSLQPEGVSPATIFGSSAVQDFFDWARAEYDYVVVDAPPYGLVGDVVSLSVMVDSVIIMCCPDRTHFRPIQSCSRRLQESGANIIGVVVNDVDSLSDSAFSLHQQSRGYGKYGYSYGYSYGYGVGYRPKKASDGEGKDGGKPSAGRPKAADPDEKDAGEAKPAGKELTDEE